MNEEVFTYLEKNHGVAVRHDLRVKLDVNISSQVWFMVATDLKEERYQ